MNKEIVFCPNENCKYFKLPGAGNLAIRQTQGRVQDIDLMICAGCGKTFSERRGTVYFRLKKPDYLFNQVISLSMVRASFRDIQQLTKLSKNTIKNWIERGAAFLGKFESYVYNDLQVTECQVDEMWTFVLMKDKTVHDKELEDNHEIGSQWIFIALDAVNKLVLHWKIGKRTLETATTFIGELKQKLGSKPLFTTDELPAYEEAFLKNFSEEIIPERTGNPRYLSR